MFFDMFTALGQSNANATHRSIADATTYSLLKQYTSMDVAANTWFTCDPTASTSNPNNRIYNQNAPGNIIKQASLSPNSVNLPSPINYTITALAPYGCGISDAQPPVQVTATLTYGPKNDSVTHTVLVGN